MTLPLLSWLLHQQLMDEVDDQVQSAEQAYQTELDDDLTDLDLAASLLSQDENTRRAIADGDKAAAERAAAAFTRVYPDLDVLFVRKDGTVLSRFGCSDPAKSIELADAKGVVERGCDTESVPAYAIKRSVGEGSVIVALDLGRSNLDNAAQKLGLELALIDGKGAAIVQTSRFPADGASAPRVPMLTHARDRTFIVQAFTPRQLSKYAVVAALDVTDVQRLIRQNLYIAMGIILITAVVAVAWGTRQAGVMSAALMRMTAAYKKLEEQKYVKVQDVRTGDELEDLAIGFNTMVDGLKERDELRAKEEHLRTTFGKYMTEEVMEHLLAGKVELGGEALTATILFSDIRGFTTISEKMPAKQLVGLLNEYFTEMVGVVFQERGVVDKYIGDAIMAIFGAPVPKKDDALRAVRAAIGMREALTHLNVRLEKRGQPHIRAGIGIHTGEVISGNIGHEKKMEYTVIGDTVNLASRLEGVTKDLKVDILISEDTYALVKDAIEARAMKEVTVKGRQKPVMTYEVVGLKSPS